MSVNKKFQAIVRRIRILNLLGIQNINVKLKQQYVDLQEDGIVRCCLLFLFVKFIAQLLQKEHRTQTEIEFLKRAFKNLKFFEEHRGSLSEECYDMLFQQMRFVQRSQKDILFHFGDKDHVYYVVLSGQVTLLIPNQRNYDAIRNNNLDPAHLKRKVRDLAIKNFSLKNEEFMHTVFQDYDVAKHFSAGDAFGEIAVINRTQRTGTIVCRTDCQLITLDASSFDVILREQERKLLKIKYQFLNQLPEIQNSKRNDALHSIIIKKTYLMEYVYRENQTANFIYYLNSGEIELFRKEGGFTNRISILTPGSIFGKEEVVENCNRKFNALTNSRSAEIFCLSKEMYLTDNKTINKSLTLSQWRLKVMNKQTKTQTIIPLEKDLKIQDHYREIVEKRNQISSKLLQQSLPSEKQAFMNDNEMSFTFRQKINNIKNGFFFSDLTEAQNKLFLKTRIQRNYHRSISTSKREVQQSKQTPEKRKRINTQYEPSKNGIKNLEFQISNTSLERIHKRTLYSIVLRNQDQKKRDLIDSTTSRINTRVSSSILIRRYQ